MTTPPSLPTTWNDNSDRPTGLATAINDLSIAVNTLLPLGLGFVSYTPVLTATTTNPTLGTGAVQYGRYFQIGKFAIATWKIKFGTAATAAGSGALRVSLPLPVTTNANTNSLVIGYGHLYNPDVEPVYRLGPACYKGVTYHTAPTVSTSVVGVVLNTNLPDAGVAGNLTSAYAATNVTTDRAYDANTAGNAAGRIDELADVLGTLISDIGVTFAQNISDNCSNAIPWVWGPNMELIGTMFYETSA